MNPKANEQYLQNEILSADPILLIRRLYEGALRSVSEARALLRAGDIRGRAREVMRAHAIVTELAQSLDHTRGGELSRNLAGLYDYLQRRLLEGNFRQRDEPFAEVESLLRTLLEGWELCQAIANSAQEPLLDGDDDFAMEEPYERLSIAG